MIREVPPHYAVRYSLTEPLELTPEPIVVVKRLVNDNWKPAFAIESAQGSFVKPLTKADALKCQRFQEQHPDILKEFSAYLPPINQVLNLRFSLTKKSDFRHFKQTMEDTFAEPLQRGLSSDAILKLIAGTPYASHLGQIPACATLQFVGHDFEVKRRHLIYRGLQIHNF